MPQNQSAFDRQRHQWPLKTIKTVTLMAIKGNVTYSNLVPPILKMLYIEHAFIELFVVFDVFYGEDNPIIDG